jgi:hypothetical protein
MIASTHKYDGLEPPASFKALNISKSSCLIWVYCSIVAGLKVSGATNLAIKDLPKSTAKGAKAASSVIGSIIGLNIP